MNRIAPHGGASGGGEEGLTAVVLCTVWVLWPLLAFMGGGGLAPLSAVAAAFTLPAAFRNFRPRFYMAFLAAFFAFAAASALWSPRPGEIANISFTELRFDIKSEVLRVGLLFPAFAIMMAAVGGMRDRGRRRVSAFACVALLIQLGVLVLLAAFETQALDLFSPFMPSSDEGVQNISRNSLIMAAAAPGLALALAEERSRSIGLLLGAAVIIVAMAILAVRGVYAGLLALAAAAAAVAIVQVFQRHGCRILACLIALFVLTTPLIFGLMSQGADAALADDTVSYRMAIWRRVTEIIAQHPLQGSGLGVLRTIDETIPSGVFAGQLVVPNHAHNMALQLWAETGAIGAVLLAGAIVLAGWRMPAPAELGRTAWRAAALAGAVAAIAGVSFDLWNAGWWAVSGFLAVLVVIQSRSPDAVASPPESQA